ncbi:phosphotyrosine protein [Hygrophoropsis aurantiaca]|uniref:Phosphotyrosine protein n=1 Tax=Hygrophoropsis aurantiaca TaxID=72124 RepID=A0ACB7ZVF8_9AGAM|nr:phosphotyrosine protein [Hygrophoropsis aurantiaca]
MQRRKLSISSQSPVGHSPMAKRSSSPPLPTPYPRASGPSEIIPRLYVSDLCFAENPSGLVALGITHILSAMRGFVSAPPGLHINRVQFPLEDLPFSELAAHLPAATAFLRSALSDPHARVLVHCMEGVSRSTSVVCAFLIAEYGYTPAQAIQYVKSKRRSAEPNMGFVQQLQEYADSLRSGS